MKVMLYVAFSKVAAMRTRIAAALPAPDKPLRPPGAFGVRRASEEAPNASGL